MAKWIRVKDTGLETPVSDEYFEKYKGDGWFIEIPEPKPPVKKTTAKKVEPKE